LIAAIAEQREWQWALRVAFTRKLLDLRGDDDQCRAGGGQFGEGGFQSCQL
jgi:hypothetical protein